MAKTDVDFIVDTLRQSGVDDDLIPALVMTAFFESDTACLYSPTQFNSSYPLSSINANSWSWDFGDGNSSNIQNPTHIYNAPGNYLVTLTLWDDSYSDSSLCIDSWTDTVYVYELPF